MSDQTIPRPRAAFTSARGVSAFIFTLLAVEFLDELSYGTREAAWPLIRRDLGLSYTEIGLLLGVPTFVGCALELPLGVLGDVRSRRAIILWGGACFALATVLAALGHSFAALLCAYTLLFTSSGAFVGLSQAALMDAAPARREQNMARWALSGSLGQVAGSLALSLAAARGFGWRGLFAALALVALAVTLLTRRFYPAAGGAPAVGQTATDQTAAGTAADDPAATPAVEPAATGATGDETVEARDGGGLSAGFAAAWRALRRREVLRWLVLLQLSDLMLDCFHGFIALYFVDVAGVSESRAALAVAVWTGVGLAGDFLVIPLLERVRGLSYLRASAFVTLLLFVAFLLAPGAGLKLVPLALLGVANAGWYSILKAQLYAALPGRSGTVMTIYSAATLVGGLAPLALGLFAARFGLGAMMWLLLAGPAALLALVPRAGQNDGDVLG